jgi:hypothetical protein
MARESTIWNLVVSKQIDESAREFLASEGGKRYRNLSHFVEEAVRKHIFDTTLRAVHEKNASVSQEEIETAVEEALAWARKSRSGS